MGGDFLATKIFGGELFAVPDVYIHKPVRQRAQKE